MLTLLTTTGCRPESWAICEKLMMQQDYGGSVRWVVVDDGQCPQDVTFRRDRWLIEIIRPNHRWVEGANTQQKNLQAGLRQIQNNENLVIIEDDDYYCPSYLTHISEWLKTDNLVGESGARYYNLKTKKYRQLSNFFHASLCATAMKQDAIEFFRGICVNHSTMIDLNLWKKYKGKKQLYRANVTVGIKGMPGRSGIGVGHKNDFQGKIDTDGSILKDWLKSDVSLYERY